MSLEHTDHRDKFLISLLVNGRSTEFEVDSGAAVTVVSEIDVARLFPGTTIQSTNLQLVIHVLRTCIT